MNRMSHKHNTIIIILWVALISSILVALYIPSVLRKRRTSVAQQVLHDMHLLEDLITEYYINYGEYPPYVRYNDNKLKLVTMFDLTKIDINKIPGKSSLEKYIMINYPHDPFSLKGQYDYVYYTDGKGWMLLSPGPDCVYQIDPLQYRYKDLSFNPKPFEYDPSNGTSSSGDIFKEKY